MQTGRRKVQYGTSDCYRMGVRYCQHDCVRNWLAHDVLRHQQRLQREDQRSVKRSYEVGTVIFVPKFKENEANMYIASKNYKVLCKPNCFHAKNIKDKNMVKFNDIFTGLAGGYRPCMDCMPAEYRAWDTLDYLDKINN